MKWAKWFGNANRLVASETIGKSRVSTVFLGLDHRFGEGKPLLFETMVFGGDGDGAQDRCTTWEEAEAMHARMVDRVKNEAPNAALRGDSGLIAGVPLESTVMQQEG
jgi:hypothetical protein